VYLQLKGAESLCSHGDVPGAAQGRNRGVEDSEPNELGWVQEPEPAGKACRRSTAGTIVQGDVRLSRFHNSFHGSFGVVLHLASIGAGRNCGEQLVNDLAVSLDELRMHAGQPQLPDVDSRRGIVPKPQRHLPS
jgi:hypothetical protein